MKKLALLAAAIILNACGNSDDSSVSAFRTVAHAPSAVVFTVDDRPVDGILTVLRIKATADGKFDATALSSFVDRRTGNNVEKVSTIENQMACSFSAALVTCTRDLRPVDGPKIVLVIKKDVTTYTATKYTSFVDRSTGQEVNTSVVIAERLTRTNS